jgi:hypothetical protein
MTDKYMSHNSPASKGASKGSGPSGAGEMPAIGPGMAARRTRPMNRENPTGDAASSARPKGMKTYNQE